VNLYVIRQDIAANVGGAKKDFGHLKNFVNFFFKLLIDNKIKYIKIFLKNFISKKLDKQICVVFKQRLTNETK